MTTNTMTLETTKPPSRKAAWICLIIAWICFVLPIPGIGLLIGLPLNLVAFILAIVAMSKAGAKAGLLPLLASLIASPIIYFIGMTLFVGGIASSINKSEKAVQVAAQSAPPVTASADELLRAYKDNQVSANAKYKDKRILISAKIDAIQAGIGDKPYLLLKAGDQYEFSLPQAHMADDQESKSASLKKGQNINLQCIGNSSIAGTPMLKDCSIL